MSDENTGQQAGGEAVPASNTPAQQPAPKNDAEAAQREAAAASEQGQQPTDAEKAAKAEADKQAEEKKRNRTRDYINRINGENAEMRRKLAELEARERPPAQQQRPGQSPQQHQAPRAPTLEDHNYDFAAWQQATLEFQSTQLRKQLADEQKQAESTRSQQETQARYDTRAAAFADAHPDFFEVVGSIDPSFLTAELQAAVIGHEQGPEIAYHLANNEDDLWSLASIRAELLPAAIARLASRVGAAQSAPPANAPNPPPPANPPSAKPVSQAPPPPPTVSGRSPTDTPQEKLTDDEWYRRDVERRRKR